MSALAQLRRISALRLQSADDGDVTDSPTWDVRAVRLVDEATGELIVMRLLDSVGLGRSTGLPTVFRAGPAVSQPWFGELRVTRIPIRVTAARAAALGCVEVMMVGAGTAEIRVCLSRHAGTGRARQTRRLRELAEHTAGELLRAAGVPNPRRHADTPPVRTGGDGSRRPAREARRPSVAAARVPPWPSA